MQERVRAKEMHKTFKVVGISVFVLALTWVCQAQTVKPDERALWDVWCAGTNSAFESAEVLEACKAFAAQAPHDPLSVVVSGFAAWNCLKQGKVAEAEKLFTGMLVVKEPATVIQKAGDRMARGWLTRLDREQVVHALKKIYARDIAFPPSLDALSALKTKPLPPLTDRWGKPWSYHCGSVIKELSAHRYVLESESLGPDSDLNKALKQPYGAGLQWQPIRLASSGKDTVEFKTSFGLSVSRELGREANNGYLVYLGTHILVLSDGNHWTVLPKPR